ncbi:hypothetical protein [Anabaena sp. CA = ATCC 33047]|uniref:hypothetical protein n=1 Tax=Anabaena sp. (strain CA / ATCC 33047) TaxID=52271 RepID=UPI00082D2FAC|nr:hypothetical protein [Anabaena sp. CA = ATCC 33047]
MLSIYRHPQQARIITAAILTGILSVSSGFIFSENATALSPDYSAQTPNQLVKGNKKSNRLPQSVANAVLQDVSRRAGIPRRNLEISDYSQQTWRNGCLNLQKPEELCTQALVPGWRVTVKYRQQRWVYHTNETGSVIRLNEKASTINISQLPRRVRNAVLKEARKVSRLPMRSLRIVDFKRTDWADGCDNVTFPNACDQIVVSGWQVNVAAGNQTWVFLTDENGSRIKLSQDGGTIGNRDIKPVRIPANELPPPLDQGVVFRDISSGGFAGRTYETILRNDGLLIRVRVGDANDSERSVRRISRPNVARFQQLLQRYRFANFNNLRYPASRGAADYISHTLTSRQGTVEYNDISQNSLPQNLQTIVEAWNQLISTAR